MKASKSIVVLFLLQSVLWSGCEPEQNQSGEVTQVKEDDKKPIDVFVKKAQKQKLYTPLEFAGLIKASEELRIYTQLSGTIKRVHVDEGSKVVKGQTLFSVTPNGLGLAYQEHQIKAPKSGVLIRLEVENGQHVAAHQELGLVTSYKGFETIIYGTESDLAYIKRGTRLQVVLSPSTPFEETTSGEVTQVAVSPDLETLAYKIKVKILCASHEPCRKGLKIGALTRVEARQNERLSYLIPSKYLHKRATKIIVVEDNKAKWKDVKTGEVFGDQTELISGIDEESIIVSSYAKRPTEGESVHIVQNEEEQKPLSTAPDQKSTHL
ncbi:MAG: biotin/lipoyl-binding protein [Oligoflexales bacterium]|nr:biotin/lipoyl-binding protein [Oligoflexales bacterium]